MNAAILSRLGSFLLLFSLFSSVNLSFSWNGGSTPGQSITCIVFTPVVIITWNTHLPASSLALVTSLLESTCLLRYPSFLCSLPSKTVVHSLLDIVQYLLSPLVSLWIHSHPFGELPLLILLTVNSSFLSVTFALFFKSFCINKLKKKCNQCVESEFSVFSCQIRHAKKAEIHS